MFEGVTVALITPFKDGRVDEKALREHIRWLIDQGVDGLLPCGTTGETPALDEEEKKSVIRIAVEEARGKEVFVIAGTGTNSTEKTLKTTMEYKNMGIDGALVVTPYYNKPTQEGLYQHYIEVSKAQFPFIIYNVPGRTGVSISPETIERIRNSTSWAVAVKEASGKVDNTTEIVSRLGEEITVLSGDDSLTLPIMVSGGKGVISVIANIVPGMLKEMVDSFRKGDIKRATEIHLKLYKLSKAMFIETNPIPVKTALYLMGRIEEEFRLPLVKMSERNKEYLKEILKEYGLI